MTTLSPSAPQAPAQPPFAAPKPREDRELAAIVQGARLGDSVAWTRLVGRFDRTLRNVARSYRLPAADVDEVVQATWLELFQGIERIREPAAIGAWLTTVTRRKALRAKQLPLREQLTDDPDLWERPDPGDPEAGLLAAERRTALAGALEALPDHHRRLLSVLLTQPDLEYREVAELLSMPVGSIGPTRARALARLAGDDQLRAVSDAPLDLSGGALAPLLPAPG